MLTLLEKVCLKKLSCCCDQHDLNCQHHRHTGQAPQNRKSILIVLVRNITIFANSIQVSESQKPQFTANIAGDHMQEPGHEHNVTNHILSIIFVIVINIMISMAGVIRSHVDKIKLLQNQHRPAAFSASLVLPVPTPPAG